MPSMANLTVKKADGTTDIVYDQLSPAGGDGSPAVWRQDTGATAGLPVGMRATLQVRAQNNGPRTARRVETTYKRPYAVQNSTTTRFETSDSIVASASVTIPQAIPAGDIEEAIYQWCNLMATTLIKQAHAAGYAPT